MAAVMKKSTHPRVPPPLTPPLCPLDLPFPWRPPCPTDPCPQTGWLRAFPLIMRLAPPAKGLRPPDFHDLLRLLRSEWFSETSLFTRELKKLRKLRYLVDVLESRGWIFEKFVKLIFWSAEGEVVEEFSRKPRVPLSAKKRVTSTIISRCKG